MARHEGADISHDDESVGFMQNAGIDIRINKVGQLATLEFSTKWAIYHWNLRGLLPISSKSSDLLQVSDPVQSTQSQPALPSSISAVSTTFRCSDSETLIFTLEPLKNVPQWPLAPIP
jgi:hypothetical protein